MIPFIIESDESRIVLNLEYLIDIYFQYKFESEGEGDEDHDRNGQSKVEIQMEHEDSIYTFWDKEARKVMDELMIEIRIMKEERVHA